MNKEIRGYRTFFPMHEDLAVKLKIKYDFDEIMLLALCNHFLRSEK